MGARHRAELRRLGRRHRRRPPRHPANPEGGILATFVHADRRTVAGRETGHQGYTTAALIETAHALGYRVALIAADDTTDQQEAA